MSNNADLSLKIFYKSTSSLANGARAARKHDKAQIDQLAASISAFGFIAPVVIDTNGRIVAGHARVLAANKLGMATVPTICVVHLSDEQMRAYALADNRIAENATWDEAVLKIELKELDDFGIDLTIAGFDTGELDRLIQIPAFHELDDAADIDTPNPPHQAVTRVGDIWALGGHKLACGNALEREVMQALMGEERAQASFSDPPYNVPIKGHVLTGDAKGHGEFAMAAGEMSKAEFTAFLESACTNIAAHSIDGSLHFVCMDWRHIEEIENAGARAFTELKNLCVWAKLNGGMGSMYRSAHELVFLFKLGAAPHINNIQLGVHGRDRTNVWSYAGLNSFSAERDELLAMHPTVKPVALVRDVILDCTKRRHIVIDAFAGSGTTILAAEQCNRFARAIELDPGYCDVAIARWERMTGRQATLLETGETFAVVSQRRNGVALDNRDHDSVGPFDVGVR